MDLLDYINGLQKTHDQSGQDAYIMYHGTTLQNAFCITQNGFICSTDGMLGPGVYVTRSFQKAAAYPITLQPGEVRVILRLRVRVGKVKQIDYQGHPLQKTWQREGYDTAWVPPNCGMVPSGLEEGCVWDPKRIDVLELLNSDGIAFHFGPMSGPVGQQSLPMQGNSCPPPEPPVRMYTYPPYGGYLVVVFPPSTPVPPVPANLYPPPVLPVTFSPCPPYGYQTVVFLPSTPVLSMSGYLYPSAPLVKMYRYPPYGYLIAVFSPSTHVPSMLGNLPLYPPPVPPVTVYQYPPHGYLIVVFSPSTPGHPVLYNPMPLPF